MQRRFVFAALLALGAQQLPIFRTGASFVRVDVYPSKDGRIVPGLTRNDFQVFEDGKPQTVETFDFIEFPTFASEAERRDPATREDGEALAADPRNRVFVVFLDTFYVSIAEAHRARLPLIAFLDRTIGPSDVFGVLTPRQPYSDLTFGRKVAGTEDMLTRHWVWGESEFVPSDETANLFRQCYAGMMPEGNIDALIARERQERVLLRLRELVDYLGRLRQERKNLVLFSHGWTLAGPMPQLMTGIRGAPEPKQPGITMDGRLRLGDRSRGDLPASTCEGDRIRLANEDFGEVFRELLDAARRANVTFYPVNPAGLSAESGVATGGQGFIAQELELRQSAKGTPVDHLRELASNTDGIAVVDTNDLRTAMIKITDSLSAYYLLGYYPTNSKMDGGVRKIEVKLAPTAPKGLDVRARRQYRAPSEKDSAAFAKAAAAGSGAAGPAGPTDVDVALATLARLGAARADVTGRATLTGVSEITLVAEAARALTSGADVQAIVTDPSGASLATGRARILAGERATSVRLALPPGARGPWQVVMRVTSPDGNQDARGGDTFEVAASTGIISDAVLTRMEPGAPARPVAIPVFSRRERLRAEWTMTAGVSLPAGASPASRQARVLDRRGQPLPLDVTLTERDDRGRTMLAADTALAALSPGDYMIELTVIVDGQTTRRLIAFRVTQ